MLWKIAGTLAKSVSKNAGTRTDEPGRQKVIGWFSHQVRPSG
jgi:hypothetical protein